MYGKVQLTKYSLLLSDKKNHFKFLNFSVKGIDLVLNPTFIQSSSKSYTKDFNIQLLFSDSFGPQ